jgi:hypothetical protein
LLLLITKYFIGGAPFFYPLFQFTQSSLSCPIDNLGEDREGIARALSGALETIVYDALVRVRVPGKGPLIVAAYEEKNTAYERAEKVATAGFRTIILGQDEVETDETRTIVRRFLFGNSELEIEARTGDPMRIEYSRIGIIIRGTRIAKNTETETVKSRKFNAGRAILSSGLITTKSVKVTQQSTTELREGFIHLYSGNRHPLVFIESALLYDSLGPALQPTRAANFAFVLAELRRRCTTAVYDDRLVNKAGQSRLLGPKFDPERHLDIAVSLLLRSLHS